MCFRCMRLFQFYWYASPLVLVRGRSRVRLGLLGFDIFAAAYPITLQKSARFLGTTNNLTILKSALNAGQKSKERSATA